MFSGRVVTCKEVQNCFIHLYFYDSKEYTGKMAKRIYWIGYIMCPPVIQAMCRALTHFNI